MPPRYESEARGAATRENESPIVKSGSPKGAPSVPARPMDRVTAGGGAGFDEGD